MIRALALALALAPALALGQAVDVQLVPKALAGKGQPKLTLTARAALKRLELELQREGGGKAAWKPRAVRAGEHVSVPLRHDAPGEARWSGRLVATFLGGATEEMPLDLRTELVPPLELHIDRARVDLAARTMEVVFNRPLAQLDLEVHGEGGRLGGTVRAPLAPHPAREPFPLEWSQPDGTQALVLRVTAKDPDGFFTALELYPWAIEIPHEEVNFDTGKSDIRPEERPKLDASLARVNDAVRKYGKWAPEVKLYIAGHTDTVAGMEFNRALSRARARAIGAYFRGRGLKIAVMFAGLGEEALAVATADETGEPRNRRAEYIVAVEPPPIRNASVEPRWERLP